MSSRLLGLVYQKNNLRFYFSHIILQFHDWIRQFSPNVFERKKKLTCENVNVQESSVHWIQTLSSVCLFIGSLLVLYVVCQCAHGAHTVHVLFDMRYRFSMSSLYSNKYKTFTRITDVHMMISTMSTLQRNAKHRRCAARFSH